MVGKPRTRGYRLLAGNAFLVTFTAVAGMALAMPANAAIARDTVALQGPTGPLDPKCQEMPLDSVCQGGPYYQGPPTGPADPRCIAMPTDGVCQGGPFAPPPPPVVAPPPAIAPPVIAPPPMAATGMPGTI